jgi:hypothetical protein
MTAKNLVTLGKAWRKNVTYVRKQDGSCGCRRAHERFLIAGLAGDVIGFMARTVRGRVCLLGKRMGDTNGLDAVRYP